MNISDELRQKGIELENEHKLNMSRIIAEYNQKIIEYNTDLGKYFLFEHLIENLTEKPESIELIKTMKYKETIIGCGTDENEDDITLQIYQSKSIIFENEDGKKLSFLKLIKGWDTSIIDIKLDEKIIDFDSRFMAIQIDTFIAYRKKNMEN